MVDEALRRKLARQNRTTTKRTRTASRVQWRRMLVESLEPRRLLAGVAIDRDQQEALLGGVVALVDFGDRLETTSELSSGIPLLGQTAGELLDIGDVLQQTLGSPIHDYLQEELEPNSDGLAQAIRLALAGDLADGLEVVGQPDVTVVADDSNFSLEFQYEVTRHLTHPLDLASTLEEADIQADAVLSVPLDLTFQLDAVLDVAAQPGTAAPLFSVHFGTANQIRASASFTQDVGETISAHLGLLGLEVQDATFRYDMGLDLQPQGDTITTPELLSTALGQLVTLVESGATENLVELNLPLTTDLPGVPLAANAQFTVRDEQLFDDQFAVTDSAYVSNGADNLLMFRDLTSAELFGLVKQIGTLLNDAGNSAVFQREIPLTGGHTLGDVLDLGEAYFEEVTSAAGSDASDGGPLFATAQGLASLIADNLHYVDDPATGPTLLFDIVSRHSFDTITYPLDFNISLGDLTGITVSPGSEVGIEADVAMNVSFGVQLRKPGADFLLTESTLLESLHGGQGIDIRTGTPDMEITLRNGARFTVDLAGAVDIGDVIDRVHAAAHDAGVAVPGDPGGIELEMSINDDKSGLHIVDMTQGSDELQVRKFGASLAVFGLGLSQASVEGEIDGRPLYDDTASDNLFLLENASPLVSASVRVLVDDIDAAAHLGPIELTIVNGTGVGQLDAQFSLGDPGTDAFDQHLTLGEISGAIASTSARLVADNRVQFADTAAQEYGGNLTVTILEGDGSQREFLVPFQVPAMPAGSPGRIDAIVAQLNARLGEQPGGQRVVVGHAGDRLTFALTDGVARMLEIAPATVGDVQAATQLGIGETLSGYVMRPFVQGTADFDLPLDVTVGGPDVPGGLNVGGLVLPGSPHLTLTIPDFSLSDFSAQGPCAPISGRLAIC